VDIHLEPILTSKGELSGFISIEKDVTKEEKHQHDLGELSASIYEKLVEAMDSNGSAPFVHSADGAESVPLRATETPDEFIRRWRHRTSISVQSSPPGMPPRT
jgi:hypothetical protein